MIGDTGRLFTDGAMPVTDWLVAGRPRTGLELNDTMEPEPECGRFGRAGARSGVPFA